MCARVLLYGFIEERHLIDADDVQSVAADLEAERLAVVAVPGHVNGAVSSTLSMPAYEQAMTVPNMDGYNNLLNKIERRLDDMERHLERNDKLLKMMSLAIANTTRRD